MQKKERSIKELAESLKNGTIKSDNIAEIIPVNEDTMVSIPVYSWRKEKTNKSNNNDQMEEKMNMYDYTPSEDEIREALQDEPELLEFWKNNRGRLVNVTMAYKTKISATDLKQIIRIIKEIEDEKASRR